MIEDDAGAITSSATASSQDAVVGKQNDGTERNKSKILRFKVAHILISIFFGWLVLLHLLGLLLFGKGFLLTRLVLESKSSCSILPDGSTSTAQNGCWHPRTFQKAVIIVIDALRYDFTVPFQPSSENSQPSIFHNNFPFLCNTAVQNPQNAFLLPFIADPPTSTLQRLKGLTTGTLPTFIDIGSNFAGTAVEEDNLLMQLKAAGKTIVHLGDDTWHSLFPGYFDENLTHPYDSFNVWDLHTVDNGVIEHIFPLLDTTNTPHWDVVFGHFLGVDHAGHRYGPDHPAMAEKLQQMDRVMRDIVANLPTDTLLVVMGDHGMDTKGDHGGESDDEVQAALWMYSKDLAFGRLHESHSKPPRTAKERPVGQIDLVSTLSLLLGLPIPYNNLGTPIVEAFTGPHGIDWANLAAVDLLAFEQIQRYQNEYSRSRKLDINQGQFEKYQATKRALQGARRDKWRAVHEAYREWHTETISMYRSLWANFNLVDMLHGVEILAVAAVSLALAARVVHEDKANAVSQLLRLATIGSGAGIGAGFLSSLFIPQYFSVLTGTIYFSAMFGGLAVLASIVRASKSLSTLSKPSFWGWLSLIFTVTQAAGFASNSYTIHEDTILLFFLTTFGAVALMSSARQISKSDRILGIYHSILFILLTRVSSYSRLCREEQMPGCRSTFYASSTSSTSSPWQLLIPYAIALILPELIKAFYTGTASYVGSAGFWIGFCFRLGLLFIAVHWTMDAADNANWLVRTISSSSIKTINISLARCALGIAIPIGISTFVFAKPCIDISIEQSKSSPDSAIPTPTKPQITILGYANAFGSTFTLIIPILILCIILLLPPMGQFSLAICSWQILCLLEILDTNNLTINSTSNSSIGPIVLAMLGSYHFFKTGHQAVLSSIQWNSAFIPLRTIVYPWTPIFVIFNTYGAQILCAAAVPLVALWKRPIAQNGLRNVWNDVINACLTHVLYYATIHLATTMWAGHLRRHLMLYRVFMPRFLMASGALFVVDIVIIFVALLSVRMTGLKVGEIFGY